MKVIFSSKAQVLDQLRPILRSARILPSLVFTVSEWRTERSAVLQKVIESSTVREPYVVRSSSASEDGMARSNAGKFVSVINVTAARLEHAIEQTIESYGAEGGDRDQFFIQPMLRDVTLSGVMFTRDPTTGAPYYVINYDTSGDTTGVTSGRSTALRTLYISKFRPNHKDLPFRKLLDLARELESVCGLENLDIEFAFDTTGELTLFQVRPLVINRSEARAPDECASGMLSAIETKISRLSGAHPYLHGAKTVFGVMPDWNPAEIIGIRPRPLALSLYKELITDNIWAYQRDNYGYKNLRSFPLLVDFFGLPYIDVRVSFNSFLPKDIDASLSERLVNYYVARLEEKPELHDKVEFDIVFSCYTFDLPERIKKLLPYGFTESECRCLLESLRRLTNGIIHRQKGLWTKDAEKIETLKKRQELISAMPFDPLSKIYWLIEDCKRYGTLPFAGLARAGFIAVQILNSMVTCGILTPEQRLGFLNSLESVSSQITFDLYTLDQQHFLSKYGHLRPGTYDILSPRYDERPSTYFDWEEIKKTKPKERSEFQLNLHQMNQVERMLSEHGLEHDVVGLFSFLKAAIEGREYSKFVFTRSLSDVLMLIKRFGAEAGFSEDDLSYLTVQSLMRLYSSCLDTRRFLQEEIRQGRHLYAQSMQVILPPLIISENDVWAFELPENKPNFITHKVVVGPVLTDLSNPGEMRGSIVMIPSADPGYDWIFTRGIAGFVTAYGGVNSHMAIRAGELGLPAVIGAGEKLFQLWSQARKIHIDCANHRVEIVN